MQARSALLALLALTLAAPGDAQARKKKSSPPAVEQPALPTLEERQAVFGEIDAAFKEGRKKVVADLLVEVTANPEHAAFHAESWARLGAVLRELDLPYSALVAYERALATDAMLVSDSAKAAIELADEVGDTALLESVFSANVGLDVDAATRSRMAYLAAREAHAQGKLGTTIAILKMVKSSDPFYPEAKALEGVALARQGRNDDALAPLLTARGAGATANRGVQFNDLLNLNLARAYYAAENYPRAAEYYAEITRGSRYWSDALFERSWAHFRMQDMNGALGLLHTHDSPFFEGWYYPEAALLRIHSLFLMCKFPEASKKIDEFRSHYGPVRDELAALGARDADWLFTQMTSHVEDGESELPRMITWRFEAEERFLDNLAAIRHAEDEVARLKGVSTNPFSADASDWVTARRDSLQSSEGERIQARIRKMEAELTRMLNDAEMSKLDMLEFETKLYTAASAKGKMLDSRRTVSRKARVKDDQRWWAWEGEYWADEVGYYKIDTKPDCPAGLKVGG